MGFGSRQQLGLWGRIGAAAVARCAQQHFTAWWRCCATRVGECSDPWQPPPKLGRVPLPEGHPSVPLSFCPAALAEPSRLCVKPCP